MFIFAHTHVEKVSSPFIQIVNVLDLYFQGQSFESSACVIIMQTVAGKANIAIANKYEVANDLSIGLYTIDLAHSKSQGQVHAQFDDEYL